MQPPKRDAPDLGQFLCSQKHCLVMRLGCLGLATRRGYDGQGRQFLASPLLAWPQAPGRFFGC